MSKRAKVKTKKEKLVSISADRNLFGRLVIAAKSRDINLKEVIPYELSSIPFSIAHLDGTLRKTTKSDLLAELEKPVCDEVQSQLPAPTNGMTTAYLTDAMAVIQILKYDGVSTFGKLAYKLLCNIIQVHCCIT